VAKRRKSPIVYIDWVDSCGIAPPWMNADQTVPIERVVSVGYLHVRTKESVVIVQSIGTSHVSNPMAIPRRAITKMRRMK